MAYRIDTQKNIRIFRILLQCIFLCGNVYIQKRQTKSKALDYIEISRFAQELHPEDVVPEI